MRLLVEWGADFNVRDKQGCTPLIVAAQQSTRVSIGPHLAALSAQREREREMRARRWGQADAAAYLVKIG